MSTELDKLEREAWMSFHDHKPKRYLRVLGWDHHMSEARHVRFNGIEFETLAGEPVSVTHWRFCVRGPNALHIAREISRKVQEGYGK